MPLLHHRLTRHLLALLLVAMFALIATPASPLRAAIAHPRIIVTRGEFAALRARAAKEPWASMKTDALAKAATLSYDPSLALLPSGTRLRNVVSAISLAYILDADGQRRAHAQRLYAQLKEGITDFASKRVGFEDVWDGNVPYGNALFSGIIGLDVVYDDLTAGERSELEALLDAGRASLKNDWKLSPIAVDGVWDIYIDNGNLPARRAEYLAELDREVTPDGVFAEGAGYALVRFGDTQREQKALFMDVLEYQGFHDFYTNPRYQTLYRWIYDHALSPSGKSLGFGDSTVDSGATTLGYAATTTLLRAGRFGDAVLRAASRHVGTEELDGRLLSYILMQTPPRPGLASQPVSEVFPDSGAWFVDSAGSNGLTGALWNLGGAKSTGHIRPETNSIVLAGYGEQLLVNAGYPGWNNDALGFSWNYIHKRAIANNTLLIDYDPTAGGTSLTDPSPVNDHQSIFGSGIADSLQGDDLEYARGDSKDALPNGSHTRSFVFVRPQAGVNGYWLVFDSVDATRANATISTVLHPYSTQVTAETAKLAYRAAIREVVSGTANADVGLTIFYATPPASVTPREGVISSFRPNTTFVGTYLQATYPSDSAGQQQIATVLFPDDATHARAQLARISSGGAQPNYTGARIDHGGGIVDYALVSGGTASFAHNPTSWATVQFQAANTVYRLSKGILASAFIGQGRVFRFSPAAGGALGIAANTAITGHYNGSRWQVVAASDSAVTLTAPNITQVTVDGVFVTPVAQSATSITVRVRKGSHVLRAFTNTTLPAQVFLPVARR